MGNPIVWIAALCLFGKAHAGMQRFEGRIVRVSDGNTITLLHADNRQHMIRFDEIDAPERGQPFWTALQRRVAKLLTNREGVSKSSRTDRYQRRVYCVLVDGTDAGLEQIRVEMAWYFRCNAKELLPSRRRQYDKMEAHAQSGRRGLWADDEPVPPWDCRKSKTS